MTIPILTRPAPPADHRISYGPDPLHFGDLRLPTGAGPHPVVIVIHGGFWRARYDLEHIGHLCAALTAAGLATWSIEYRRIGNPGGGWPGTFQDVALAAESLRDLAPRYALDLDHTLALGHSAGGHLALWLAARHRIPLGSPLYPNNPPLSIHAVVSLAGVADLERAWTLRLSTGVVEEFLNGTPTSAPDRYQTASPAALLPLGVRQLLVHGTADEPVPFEISQHYHARALALGDNTTLLPLPNNGHFELIDPLSREWPTILTAILSLLPSFPGA
jgi:acetyl esterase/lipase